MLIQSRLYGPVTTRQCAEIASGGRPLVAALLLLPLTLGAALQMKVFTARQGDWPLPILRAAPPNVPHLFLMGGLDPLTPPGQVEAVLKARRGALDGAAAAPSRVTHVDFPTASHLQLLEKEPRKYEAAVCAFVEACYGEMVFSVERK